MYLHLTYIFGGALALVLTFPTDPREADEPLAEVVLQGAAHCALVPQLREPDPTGLDLDGVLRCGAFVEPGSAPDSPEGPLANQIL